MVDSQAGHYRSYRAEEGGTRQPPASLSIGRVDRNDKAHRIQHLVRPARYSLPSSKSTTQQPRTCGSEAAAVVDDVVAIAAGVLESIHENWYRGEVADIVQLSRQGNDGVRAPSLIDLQPLAERIPEDVAQKLTLCSGFSFLSADGISRRLRGQDCTVFGVGIEDALLRACLIRLDRPTCGDFPEMMRRRFRNRQGPPLMLNHERSVKLTPVSDFCPVPQRLPNSLSPCESDLRFLFTTPRDGFGWA